MPLVAAAAITAGGALLANNSNNKAQAKGAAAGQQATDQAAAEARRQYDLSRSDNQPWLQAGQGALAQLSRLYGLNTQTPQPQAAMTQAYSTGQQGGQVSYGGSVPAYDGRQGGTYAQMMSLVDSGQLQGDGPTMGTGQYGQAQPVPQAMPTQTPTGTQPQGGQFDTFWQSPDYNFRQNEQARALTARNAMLGIQDSGAAQRSAMQLSGNMASAEYNNYANRLAALAGVGQTAAGQNQQLGQNYAGAVGNLVTNNANNLASSYQQTGQNNANLWGGLAGITTGYIGQRWPGVAK
jgi:hypothetical protein